MNLPPPSPSGGPIATLPSPEGSDAAAPAPPAALIAAAAPDPFAPSPDLLAAAPPPPARPSFATPPPRPAPPAARSAGGEVEAAEVAPLPTKRRARRTGTLPTLPARVLAFVCVPLLLGLLLWSGLRLLDAPDEGATVTDRIGASLIGATVLTSLAIYLGLLGWMVMAAINARRITQLAVSPMTSLIVLVGGPAAMLVGGSIGNATQLDAQVRDFVSTGVVLLGLAILGLGHLVLLASYRSTAERLGAARQPWSVLIWTPIGLALVQLTLTMLVYPRIESDRIVVFVWLLSLVGWAVLSLAYVLSMWRAMSSFDHACRRDRSLEKADVLPDHFVFGRI
jgi:hypothetical protein